MLSQNYQKMTLRRFLEHFVWNVHDFVDLNPNFIHTPRIENLAIKAIFQDRFEKYGIIENFFCPKAAYFVQKKAAKMKIKFVLKIFGHLYLRLSLWV